MQLHELKPTQKIKSKKRVGRGGKRGTYSGRGMKGQKSRAGHRIRPASRDLIQRLPKWRGFKFRPLKSKSVVISISALAGKIKNNIINRQTLLQAGLIRQSDRKIKILGPKKEEIKQAFQIEGLEVSKKLKKAIEASGGNIVTKREA